MFVSDRIEKGVAWFDAIVKRLETSKVGVICLTAENVESPWLHFESGALALRLAKDRREEDKAPASAKPLTPGSRLFTLLHGVTGAELKGPLGAYQATGTSAPEVATMIHAIGQILGGPHLEAIMTREHGVETNPSVRGVPSGRELEHVPRLPPVFERSAWKDFRKELDELAIPARDLIRELDSWFQRKTFNEPLHACADQAWLRRYDGASQTRDRLSAHINQVRAACPEHESSLFEMLLSEVDGYAMTLAALLLTPRAFPLGDRGELTMDPGIRTSCEDRRLAIRSLARRLLNSDDGAPLQGKEAVRFMGAETNQERKMIVHRLESAIRSKWEGVYHETNKGQDAELLWRAAIGELTDNRGPINFRASSWDLDRIFYYLLIDYFRAAALRWMPLKPTSGSAAATSASLAPIRNLAEPGNGNLNPMPQDIMFAARDVETEVERYRAKSKGGSLMPLTYALAALQALRIDIPDPHDRDFERAQTDVSSAINLVKQEFADVLKSDAGRALARLVDGTVQTDSSIDKFVNDEHSFEASTLKKGSQVFG